MSLSGWREDSRMIKKKSKTSKMKLGVKELFGISKEIFIFWNWVKSTELTITKRLQKKWILIDWLSKTVWENYLKSSNLNQKISKNKNLKDSISFKEFFIVVLKFHQDQLQLTMKQKQNLWTLMFKFIKTNWTLTPMNLKQFLKCQNARTHLNTMRLIKLIVFLVDPKKLINKSFKNEGKRKSKCFFEVLDLIQDMDHRCNQKCLQELHLLSERFPWGTCSLNEKASRNKRK